MTVGPITRHVEHSVSIGITLLLTDFLNSTTIFSTIRLPVTVVIDSIRALGFKAFDSFTMTRWYTLGRRPSIITIFYYGFPDITIFRKVARHKDEINRFAFITRNIRTFRSGAYPLNRQVVFIVIGDVRIINTTAVCVFMSFLAVIKFATVPVWTPSLINNTSAKTKNLRINFE